MPAFAARLVLGEMADELLLASTRVEPQQLVQSGYEFRQPTLEVALRHLLGRAGVRFQTIIESSLLSYLAAKVVSL